MSCTGPAMFRRCRSVEIESGGNPAFIAGTAAFASLGLVVFGALPMVLGMAIVRSSVYPHWIGFVALAAGVVGIVMGVLTAVEGEVTTTVTTLFLVASIPTTLVWLGTGLLLRQHASRELVGAAPTATPA